MAIGAWYSFGRAFSYQFDSVRSVGGPASGDRAVGGLMAGFRARVAAGCTSGLGLQEPPRWGWLPLCFSLFCHRLDCQPSGQGGLTCFH